MAGSVMKTASPLLQELAARHQEPDWLRNQRAQAWEQYEQLPIPQLEKTDVSRRNWSVGTLPEQPATNLPAEAAALVANLDESVAVVVIQDGVIQRVSMPAALHSKGIVFSGLHAAIEDHADLVKRHLGTVVSSEESKWAALNAAVWTEGAFVYVPRHVDVDVPLLFLHVQSGQASGVMPRVLLVAEEGSRVSFTEMYVPADGSLENTLSSAVVEVVAGAGAQVTVASLTQW
ncbi:MAG: hypothetical protein K6T83_18035, partial [Alicyclobacillus sp.]|nr:hypothetical protein [Alicyclobacillus sp.]